MGYAKQIVYITRYGIGYEKGAGGSCGWFRKAADEENSRERAAESRFKRKRNQSKRKRNQSKRKKTEIVDKRVMVDWYILIEHK